jgi:hypothetical protein
MKKKYWHEMSDEEWDTIHDGKHNYPQIRKLYKQPNWCKDAQAIHPLGCWSLIDKKLRKQISIKYCKKCVCFKKEVK